ncbi:DoxX family protein [Dactylosporangium fulvum]|uniref:DoxX family protein n=2 Tax=Dactylosporangium fulvum TaxID=53359 RepID=A0ABY5W0T3_9ACTN|nr:DoxX family protein [Dactylosporangium fulvum]UWP82711.1 DoxX family protein [Dactylosporangium fulvum]
MRPVRTVARSMLAALFVVQGWQAARHPAKLADQARPVTDRLEPTIRAVHPRLPTEPETLVRLNGAAQFAGGLLLATGHATTPAALLLAGSMVPTTIAGHPFWKAEDPAQRGAQRVQFLKNLGIIGGLVFAALDNEGRPGLAWRTRHTAEHAAWRTRHAAEHAGHRAGHIGQAAQRALRTTRRDARIALRAARAGRRLPA